MEAHLAKTLAAIRSGSVTDAPLGDAEKEALLEGEQEPMPRRTGRPSMAPEYRPGLTTLVESLGYVHTLAVTDLSRISRSQILFADLAERLTAHRVRVAGLMEYLSWISGSGDIGADIVAYVLSCLAEYRLGELVIHSPIAYKPINRSVQ